jgi:hypothetical protein
MTRAIIFRFENNKPIVITETNKKGIFKQYSSDKASDDSENAWYQENGESLNRTLEMVGHGWTMYDQQLLNYEGDGKTKIDSALKELGINQPQIDI